MHTFHKLKLVALLATLALGLSGCALLEMFNPPEPVDPATEFVENELMSYTRTTLPEVGQGKSFTVQVVAVAKAELQLFAVSETVPEGFTVVAGETTRFLSDAAPDEQIELNYTLKAGSQRGDFAIEGFARGLPAGAESVQLELSSPLKVR